MPTPSSASTNVFIVILHWRGIEVTRRCLQSLQALTFTNYKTLLVDNGSDDNDGGILKQEFEQIEVLRLAENHGFAGGCNKGIQACIDMGAKFVWMLNNDTVVAPESLATLLAEAEDDVKAGVLGAVIVDSLSQSQKVIVAGVGRIDFVKAKTSVVKSNPVSQAVSCQWLHGSNLLLRAEALRAVGLFDERYFLYFEDTELCHRMRLHGWQCLLVPKAEIEHIGSASTTGKRRFWRSYYYIRNRFLFFETYLPGIRRLPATFFMLMHILRHIVVLPFRGENGRYQLKAELLGLKDYMGRRFGKAECLDWCEG